MGRAEEYLDGIINFIPIEYTFWAMMGIIFVVFLGLIIRMIIYHKMNKKFRNSVLVGDRCYISGRNGTIIKNDHENDEYHVTLIIKKKDLYPEYK